MPTRPIFPPESLEGQKLVPHVATYGGQRVEGLDTLPPERQLEWRDRLHVNAEECGCELSARAGAFVVGAYILAVLTGLLDVGGTGATIAIGAGVFVLASAGGKAYGLGRAHNRLSADLEVLRDEIAAGDDKRPPTAG